MILLQKHSWRDGEIAVACDFNHRGNLAALLRSPSGTMTCEIDRAIYVVPDNWAVNVARIKWLGDAEVLLWPVSLRQGTEPSVGIIGPHGTRLLDLTYPLQIFTDREAIAWCYSEERNVAGGEIITMLKYPDFRKISQFVTPFMERYKGCPLLELEQGVLDGISNFLWFTAYDTESIWCFSAEYRRISVGSLGCSRSEIAAVSCSGCFATVLIWSGDKFYLRIHEMIGDVVAFRSEAVLIDSEVIDLFSNVLSKKSAEVSGYAGNRISLVTDTEAILLSV